MSRKPCTIPVKLVQYAERRSKCSHRAQNREQRDSVVDPKEESDDSNDSGKEEKTQKKKEPGNADEKKTGVQSKTSIQQLVSQNRFASLWNTSRMLTILKSEPTYCLTGSKMVWTIDETSAPTGSWRH